MDISSATDVDNSSSFGDIETSGFFGRFTLVEYIGQTKGGEVFNAVEATHGLTRYRVERVLRWGLKRRYKEALWEEVRILHGLDHRNVIKVYLFYPHEPYFYYLVLEGLEGPELFDYVSRRASYNESDVRRVVAALLGAIKYIHDRDIVFRGLTPENIVLANRHCDTSLKLVDFSNACSVRDGLVNTVLDDFQFAAPEIINYHSHGTKVDMWSFGVIMCILITGLHPLYDRDRRQMLRNIAAGRVDFQQLARIDMSGEARDLIRMLLDADPFKRLSAAQAIDHRWFSLDDPNMYPLVGEVHRTNFVLYNAKRNLRIVFRSLFRSRMTPGDHPPGRSSGEEISEDSWMTTVERPDSFRSITGREKKARPIGGKHALELKTKTKTWNPYTPPGAGQVYRPVSRGKKRQMDIDSQHEGSASEVGARDDSAGDRSDGIKQRDDVAAEDDRSQAGWTAESPTGTSGEDDVTFLQNTRNETTKPAATSTASTAEPQEWTEGKLVLVRQFDEKPRVFSLHDAGVRLKVAQSCLGHGEVAGPITVLIDKIHLIECDGQTFLSSVVVDCQPFGKRFPIPLALDFRVGEPLDEDSEDDDNSDYASEEDKGRKLDDDHLKEYMDDLRDEYKVLVREEEGDAWSVLEDEKTRVLYEEGMFFVRASIEHFSQGCLARVLRLESPCQEEVMTWPNRKKQIEFVNATDRTLTFLVLPTSWSISAIREVAVGIAAQGVTLDVAIKRAVEQSILAEATNPQVFQVPPLRQSEPLRAGQRCPYRTCHLANNTGSEARVVLITVDGPTLTVWHSRIVPHRTRVAILPVQFSDEMTPTLGPHRYDDLATGEASVMNIALLAISRGLQLPVERAPVSSTLQLPVNHTRAFLGLWPALQSLQDTCNTVDRNSLACIVVVLLVIPCATLLNFWVDNPQA